MKKIKLKERFPNAEFYVLKHATRVNGVVDVWYNRKTVFCIPENEYKNFEDREEKFNYIEECLNKHGKKHPIKKLASGNMSIQEFRNNQIQPGYKKW